jgi:AraC family transcriptional regulator
MTEEAFGNRLGSFFLIESAPVAVSLTARKASLFLTELQSNAHARFTTQPLPRDDAFLVILHLIDNSNFKVREINCEPRATDIDAGQITIHDLKLCPSFLIDGPFHTLNFYLPRIALDEVADNLEAARIGDLVWARGKGFFDEAIRNLIGTMSLSFSRPEVISRACVDQVSLALAAHLARRYGGLIPNSRPIRGGLAPWQEKRARDLIDARLSGGVSVGDLARECGLSHRHFCRAFRHSVGSSPHSYMQSRRIERAKELLDESFHSLGDIASTCGFADQSHFTRVFTQIVGVTPGVWRRNAGGKSAYVIVLPNVPQAFTQGLQARLTRHA